jgi:hypothetical protein
MVRWWRAGSGKQLQQWFRRGIYVVEILAPSLCRDSELFI